MHFDSFVLQFFFLFHAGTSRIIAANTHIWSGWSHFRTVRCRRVFVTGNQSDACGQRGCSMLASHAGYRRRWQWAKSIAQPGIVGHEQCMRHRCVSITENRTLSVAIAHTGTQSAGLRSGMRSCQPTGRIATGSVSATRGTDLSASPRCWFVIGPIALSHRIRFEAVRSDGAFDWR